MNKKKLNIRIPKYDLNEEIFNSISHGIGLLLSIIAFVVLINNINVNISKIPILIFSVSMINLYLFSSIYHALPAKFEIKKIIRIIDHCNVYLLVLGTYAPISLLGIGGTLGYILFSTVSIVTILGIILTIISIDNSQIISLICHLINGWSILIGIFKLQSNVSINCILLLISGGIIYSIGAVLYIKGARKKYMHSLFHVFCLFGTFLHFLCIYSIVT